MTSNGDFRVLKIMGTTGKTIDVIPQISKSSHCLPLSFILFNFSLFDDKFLPEFELVKPMRTSPHFHKSCSWNGPL